MVHTVSDRCIAPKVMEHIYNKDEIVTASSEPLAFS